MATVNGTASSQAAYSYLQYKNKIGGLVSGMDIDSIMEKLMKAESAQMEKLQQQKQKYEWKRDAYREVNTSLTTFQQGIFDSYGKQSSWNTKTVANTGSDKVTATATSSAGGKLEITAATLATSGTVQNTSVSTFSSTQKLADFGISSTAGKFAFSINGEDKVVEYSKEDTIDSLVSKLNSAGANAYLKNGGLVIEGDIKVSDASYSKTFATKLGFSLEADGVLTKNDGTRAVSSQPIVTTEISSSNLKSTSKLSELGLTNGTFKLVGLNETGTDFIEKEITFKATDTVESLLTKINSSGAGVTAVMSGNKISLTSNTAGAGIDGKVMGVTEDSQGVFKKLGFFSNEGSNTGAFATTGAKNGSLTVNGMTIEQSSNTYNVAGYKLEITKAIDAGSSINITSSSDVDKTIDKVKEFIDTYNGLIKDLNTKTSEKRNVDYSPLTDAQKAEMTDAEITKWEEKAKAGLLKGDSNINSALSSMRTALSQYGGKTGDTLASLGITTSKTYTDNGKLEIDEDKLRKALEKDPDAVTRIFTGDTSTGEEGIVSKLRTAAQNAVKNIEVSAGKATSTSEKSYSLGRTISDLTSKIDDWKDRLKDIEERYWKQFSAMETAIQKANSQSSIFSQ